MSKRKPDYKVAALNKRTNEKSWRVGSAWKNYDGSIALYFDSFVYIPGGPDLLITLFPFDEAKDG